MLSIPRVDSVKLSDNVGENQYHSPQGLHDQMLNLGDRQLCFLSYRLEAHTPLIPRPLENRLNQCHQTDLLPQEIGIAGENGCFCQLLAQHLVFSNITGVEDK